MSAAEPTEHQEQTRLIEWWDWNCKRWKLPPFSLMAVPNGGARHIAVAAKLKAEGVRAGVPDLFLAVPLKSDMFPGNPWECPGLWIEMKRKPNKPSNEQMEVIDYLRGMGYEVVVAWNADEAIRAIEGYLGGSLSL